MAYVFSASCGALLGACLLLSSAPAAQAQSWSGRALGPSQGLIIESRVSAIELTLLEAPAHLFTPSVARALAAPAEAPLTVWPNPAHQLVHVGVADPTAPVRLFDALGRQVRTSPAAGADVTLDVADLPAGLYVVRCGTQTQRLLVE